MLPCHLNTNLVSHVRKFSFGASTLAFVFHNLTIAAYEKDHNCPDACSPFSSCLYRKAYCYYLTKVTTHQFCGRRHHKPPDTAFMKHLFSGAKAQFLVLRRERQKFRRPAIIVIPDRQLCPRPTTPSHSHLSFQDRQTIVCPPLQKTAVFLSSELRRSDTDGEPSVVLSKRQTHAMVFIRMTGFCVHL